jgi:serine/threonine protein kinase
MGTSGFFSVSPKGGSTGTTRSTSSETGFGFKSIEEPKSALSRLDEKFDIEGLLSKGGHGAVWSARCRETGMLVAVKSVINHSYVNTSKEVELMAKCCGHQNFAGLLESFEDIGVHYIVMERCTGKDLQQHDIRFLEPYLSRIAGRIRIGLKYLHSLAAAHGDIRLENIMFDVTPSCDTDSESDDFKVKIVDFGSGTSFEGKTKGEISALKASDLTAVDKMMLKLRSLSDRSSCALREPWMLSADASRVARSVCQFATVYVLVLALMLK